MRMAGHDFFSLSIQAVSMPVKHDATSFLKLCKGLPLFDARSPAEYENAHIPGALNLPLLSDDERAQVGTAHARSGSEAAVHIALELIGPQLAAKLNRARHLVRKEREVCLHCWRGGMRSASLAWLLETGGFTVHLLEGGYKAYRSFIRAELARSAKILVLGGMTGSGKTDILHEMASLGCQVIDLEGLAQHRGSVFGGLGMAQQPNNERMENMLYAQWAEMDFSRPIWLEDEDRRIGSVTLPQEFFDQISTGRLVVLDMPKTLREARLLRMYTEEIQDEQLSQTLLELLGRIRKRLGDQTWRACVEALSEQRYQEAIAGVLEYYDRTYTHQLSLRIQNRRTVCTLTEDRPDRTARMLAEREHEFFLDA